MILGDCNDIFKAWSDDKNIIPQNKAWTAVYHLEPRSKQKFKKRDETPRYLEICSLYKFHVSCSQSQRRWNSGFEGYSIDYKFKNELPFDARIARIVRALRIEISRKLFLPIINSVRGLFFSKKRSSRDSVTL